MMFKKNILTIALLFFCTTATFAENKINCAQLKNTLHAFRVKYHIGAMGLYVSAPAVNCYLFSGTVKHNSKKLIEFSNMK